MTMFPDITGAKFSECRQYRYRLWRVWDATLPRALFVMMNPSTADEVSDDPTVMRQQRRVRGWPINGIDMPVCGGVEVVNIFAWRETYSTNLPGLVHQGVDIIGPDNDSAIVEAVKSSAVVICGWGMPGSLLGRGKTVLKLIKDVGGKPYCLRLNDDGSPQHPLYIGYKVKPVLL